MKTRFFAIAIVCVVLCAAASAQSSGYKLEKKITIGGEGGWDYLLADPDSHRVYVSHGQHTVVVDPAEGKIIGDIPDTRGVHGIALAPEFNRGFTSNGQGNSVTIFDLKTFKTISEVKIPGQNPDAILYDPASKRVFTFNGRSKDATAIDAKTGEVAGTVALPDKPETAQSDDAGHVFVNIESKDGQLVEFDAKTLKVLNTWPIAGCEEPSGLAFDVKHKRLFAGCHNKVMAVVDSSSGKVVGTVPIGTGVDANGFDPATGYAFASCGDGTLTVAHEDSPDKVTLVENVTTEPRARTMTVDTKNHKVYLLTADFNPAPAATTENPRPRPTMVPDSFRLLVYSK